MKRIIAIPVPDDIVDAIVNRSDHRAYYTFDGDLNQMIIIYKTLRDAGFPVVKSDVYPGFAKEDEEQYKKALDFLYENRIEGWWNQERNLIRYGICTKEEFLQALK